MIRAPLRTAWLTVEEPIKIQRTLSSDGFNLRAEKSFPSPRV